MALWSEASETMLRIYDASTLVVERSKKYRYGLILKLTTSKDSQQKEKNLRCIPTAILQTMDEKK